MLPIPYGVDTYLYIIRITGEPLYLPTIQLQLPKRVSASTLNETFRSGLNLSKQNPSVPPKEANAYMRIRMPGRGWINKPGEDNSHP